MKEAKKEISVWCPECHSRKYVKANIILPICGACQITMFPEIDSIDIHGDKDGNP